MLQQLSSSTSTIYYSLPLPSLSPSFSFPALSLCACLPASHNPQTHTPVFTINAPPRSTYPTHHLFSAWPCIGFPMHNSQNYLPLRQTKMKQNIKTLLPLLGPFRAKPCFNKPCPPAPSWPARPPPAMHPQEAGLLEIRDEIEVESQ